MAVAVSYTNTICTSISLSASESFVAGKLQTAERLDISAFLYPSCPSRSSSTCRLAKALSKWRSVAHTLAHMRWLLFALQTAVHCRHQCELLARFPPAGLLPCLTSSSSLPYQDLPRISFPAAVPKWTNSIYRLHHPWPPNQQAFAGASKASHHLPRHPHIRSTAASTWPPSQLRELIARIFSSYLASSWIFFGCLEEAYIL